MYHLFVYCIHVNFKYIKFVTCCKKKKHVVVIHYSKLQWDFSILIIEFSTIFYALLFSFLSTILLDYSPCTYIILNEEVSTFCVMLVLTRLRLSAPYW